MAGIGHGLTDREYKLLCELIAKHNEDMRIGITAKASVSAWEEALPLRFLPVAAVNRLMQHSTIMGMIVESYCRRASLAR